ncbi:MAG: hypothetical protein K0Q55_425, partial [Verrucomicrobia bacterium]|nr:hypothetical protein [Verrucomicrobiota bacterium]
MSLYGHFRPTSPLKDSLFATPTFLLHSAVPETTLRTLDFDYALPPELIAQ